MRSRRERRAAERLKALGQSDRWVVSYADFVTLLLAFFTTLYAASSVDTLRGGSMVESMQQALDHSTDTPAMRPASGSPQASTPNLEPAPGVPQPVGMDAVVAAPEPLDSVPLEPLPIAVPTTGSSRVGKTLRTPPPVDAPGALHDVQARLAERLAAELASGQVAVEMDPRGLVISIREAGSFAVGSAELSPEANRIIARLGATFAEIPNPIRVEGHTDDVPIHTSRYDSNWELSTARATEVVAFLVQRMGLDPIRLSAAGYSEYHPRFSNSTQAGRARNRRVDLVILNSDTRRAEEPPTLEPTP